MTRDPLDDLGPGDRGLTELLNTLTSAPTADELSGEYAALTMFRSARAGAIPAAPPSRARRRRASRGRIGARLVAAGTVVALGGGFAAAAYAEALPPPLQRVAHQIFSFAGVPNSPANSTSKKPAVPVTSRHTTPAGSNSPQPTSSGAPRSSSPSPRPSSSASPGPSRSGTVTITASPRQIAAGGSVEIGASLTRHGKAVPGVSLSLDERPAGRTTWRFVASASTGPSGHVAFTVASLTTNASFHVTGPGRAVSAELGIVVVPGITVQEVPSAHGQREQLVVSIPLAQRGDVVQLRKLVGGQWRLVRTHPLHRGGHTEFSVAARRISVTYQVVLPATVEHGPSVSAEVTVAARKHRGGRGRG